MKEPRGWTEHGFLLCPPRGSGFMSGSLPEVYAGNGAASYSSMIWISR